MAHKIIEYIGREGVKSSDLYGRLSKPMPGDVVDFSLFEGQYPFSAGRKYGRIAGIVPAWEGDGQNKGYKEHFSVCCGGASVFWYSAESVSISGGPFTSIYPDWLEATYRVERVSFWNWGDNSPGANQGVGYWVDRPVFKLIHFKQGGQEYENSTMENEV